MEISTRATVTLPDMNLMVVILAPGSWVVKVYQLNELSTLYIRNIDLLHNIYSYILTDIDECAADTTLCMPGGTCQNLPNGNFYTCNCDTAGYESNGGDPSSGQLGCQGITTILLYLHKIYYIDRYRRMCC